MNLRDIRYALRQWRRQPGLSTTVILTLALAIGLNATLFSIVDAVLLKPLPFRDPGRLVTLEERNPAWSTALACDSAFVQWKARSRSFENIAASVFWDANLESGGQPRVVRASHVTLQYFDVMGVHPRLGRTFVATETVRNGPKVVILSDSLWKQLGSKPEIVGQTIMLDAERHTVVGVMPPVEYQGPFLGWAELWRPALFDEQRALVQPNGWRGYRLIGRLRAGVPAAQADAELRLLERTLEQELPRIYSGYTASVRPLTDYVAGDVRSILILLLGAVLGVLLIGCLNVAGLLLARGTARETEIAIRFSQGATRTHVTRQLLTESVVLSVAGALLGLVVTYGGIRFLLGVAPQHLPRVTEIHIDSRVLIFSVLLSVIAGLVMGGIPAILMGRRGMTGSLSATGRGNTASRSNQRMHNVLVVGEVALAIPLLIGACLMLRTVNRLLNVNPGFEQSGLVIFDLSLPGNRYRTDEDRLKFFRELERRLQNIPGVKAAGANRYFPLKERQYSGVISVEGRTVPEGQDPVVQFSGITSGYLRTMGIPVLEGRDFSGEEMWERGGTVLVNESFRRLFWPRENPLGKRLRTGLTNPWLTVIGVVGDVRQRGLDEAAFPQIYTPYANYKHNIMTVAVQSQAPPAAAIGQIRRVLQEMDNALPPSQMMTGQQAVERTIAGRRIARTLLVLFASIAVALAAMGLYAFLSFYVARKTQELGVRLALGAEPSQLVRLVVGKGLGLATTGLAAGLVLGFLMARLMTSLLFEVSRVDPITYAVVPIAFLIVAFWACYFPARRAIRIEPIVALRLS